MGGGGSSYEPLQEIKIPVIINENYENPQINRNKEKFFKIIFILLILIIFYFLLTYKFKKKYI